MMNIRFAREEDIPALIRLLRQVGQVHYRGRPDIFRSDAQKFGGEELSQLLKSENCSIFVAEAGENVVGYAMCILEIVQDHPVLRDSRSLFIDDFCVEEACRGQCVGRALYEAVKEEARRLGCGSVTLNVWNFPGSAQAFYEKCGLKPRKTVMESILEEETDAGKESDL